MTVCEDSLTHDKEALEAPGLLLADVNHMACILPSYWLMLITWPEYYPLIGAPSPRNIPSHLLTSLTTEAGIFPHFLGAGNFLPAYFPSRLTCHSRTCKHHNLTPEPGNATQKLSCLGGQCKVWDVQVTPGSLWGLSGVILGYLTHYILGILSV